MRPAASLRDLRFLSALLVALVGTSLAAGEARAACEARATSETRASSPPFSWQWDAGPAWLRDAAMPGTAWPDLPASAPELAIHSSEIEGGDAAAWRNHEGDPAHDGMHATLEAGGRARVGRRVTIRFRPRAIAWESGARVSWLEANAAVRAGPASLEAGRTRLWLGPARHGSLLLSTNAHPLDLVHLRLAGSTPARIPALPDLASLGGGAAVAFLTDARRDYPNPDLGVLYLRSQWSTWLAIDVYRTLLFAGEGRGFRVGWTSLGDLLAARDENGPGGAENPSDQIAAAAVEVRVDALLAANRGRSPREDGGAWIYYEYAGEDNLRRFKLRDRGITMGARWTRREWDFTAEYARNHDNPAIWYAHSVYTSGYTYRGTILGHHMGGDAQDFAMSAAAPLPGGRRARVFGERRDALFESQRRHSEEWTLGGSVENVWRSGRAAVSTDLLFRWGRRYPIATLGPIERARASVRVAWRLGGT